MLLDEPTSFLDVAHQFEIMNLLRRLVRNNGVSVVVVLHDLNQAARYADHVVVMKDRAVVKAGPSASVLTTEVVRDVFGVQLRILVDRRDGERFCVTG